MEVEIQPPSTVALDAEPYNTFTLNCIATAPDGIRVTKAFDWRENDGNIQTTLTHDGNTTSIVNSQLESIESISTLTVTEKPVGTYTYMCISNMLVPGGLNVAATASAVATVKGITYVTYSME